MQFDDPNCIGNSPKYHSGIPCIKCCSRPAGTAWGEYWCFECNVARLKLLEEKIAGMSDPTFWLERAKRCASVMASIMLLTSQVFSQQVITLSQFQKSKQVTDLSRWESNRLILETGTSGTSGWFYYPNAVSLKGIDSVLISVVVAEPSKDASLELADRLDPLAKNGAWEQPNFLRFDNFWKGLPTGTLTFTQRKNGGERTNEFLKPFPMGAHTLQIKITRDVVVLSYSGVRLKSLVNPLPDSFYVSLSASWKWVLASAQIVIFKTPIKPPELQVVIGKDVKISWRKNTEPDLSHYSVNYGFATKSYPFVVQTTDTFKVLKPDTGRIYFAAVKAHDRSGNASAFSSEVSFILHDTTKADPLDLTGDKKVNLADYTLLKANFGKAGKGDFDNNGLVDELDLLWFWRFGKFEVE